MTGPRICSQCGENPVHAKGLCSRCYQAQWYREHPDARALSRRIDQTTYRQAVEARNRAWLEQQRVQSATPKMHHDPKDWMTYREAAAFWGVPYTVAISRIQARQMSRLHVGRMALVQRADVEAYRSLATVSTSHPAVG